MLLQYDVMCAIHVPLLFVGKAQNNIQYLYIITEKALVRYDSYLPKILQLFFFLYSNFFYSQYQSE